MIGVLFFFVAVAAVMFLTKGFWWNGQHDEPNMGPMVGCGIAAILVGIFCGTIGGAVLVVQAGHRAVIFDSIHGVRPKALGEGINLITPFVQSAIDYDVRVQKVEFDASASSKDLQDVATKVAINFHPDLDSIPEIYQHYGAGYQEKVIHPSVQEVVKAVTALYTAEELITRREDVKRHIQDSLATMMEKARLHLDETYITDFKFGEEFSKAIESKQVAEQNALKARRDLDRVRLEAEQKIAGLRAEAEGLRMQKEQITPMLIKLRTIEKWDGHYPLIVSNGAVPMVKMDTLTRAGASDDDK